MIRPGGNDSLANGQYAMGNYIIMPQAALSNPTNQFHRQVQQYQVQQMGQQQILLPQAVAGQFPMQTFPFLQSKFCYSICNDFPYAIFNIQIYSNIVFKNL